MECIENKGEVKKYRRIAISCQDKFLGISAHSDGGRNAFQLLDPNEK